MPSQSLHHSNKAIPYCLTEGSTTFSSPIQASFVCCVTEKIRPARVSAPSRVLTGRNAVQQLVNILQTFLSHQIPRAVKLRLCDSAVVVP